MTVRALFSMGVNVLGGIYNWISNICACVLSKKWLPIIKLVEYCAP